MERAERLEAVLPSLLRGMFHDTSEEGIAELTLPQLRILRTLLESPRTASEVADLLGFSASGLSQLAQRLESAGLIVKSKDEQDARVKHLALSKKGKTLMERRRAYRVQQAESVLSRLGDEEQEMFLSLLEKLSAEAANKSWKTPLERITA
jgi:DNA-binding MarR family transcriptional regulator